MNIIGHRPNFGQGEKIRNIENGIEGVVIESCVDWIIVTTKYGRCYWAPWRCESIDNFRDMRALIGEAKG